MTENTDEAFRYEKLPSLSGKTVRFQQSLDKLMHVCCQREVNKCTTVYSKCR